MKRLAAKLYDGILRWAAERLLREAPGARAFAAVGLLTLLGAALAWFLKVPVVLAAACACLAGLLALWLLRRLARRAAAYVDRPGDLRRRLQQARRRGQWAEARRLGEQSLELKREAGDRAGMARELRGLGVLAQREGDWREARRRYAESLDISRELGDQPGIAEGLGQIAFIARLQGDLPEARRAYEEKLRMAVQGRDEDGVVFALVHLALIARDQHDDAWAADLAEALLDIGGQLGNQCALWEGLRLSATLAEHQGDYEEAYRLSVQSEEAFERIFQSDGGRPAAP